MTDTATDTATALRTAMLELARLELGAAAVISPTRWGGRAWETLEPGERRAMLRHAAGTTIDLAPVAPIEPPDAATVVSAAVELLTVNVEDLAGYVAALAEGEAPARSQALCGAEARLADGRHALELLGALVGRLAAACYQPPHPDELERLALEAVAELRRARGVHGIQHGLPDYGTRNGPRYWKDEGAILEDRARTSLREEPAWAGILVEEVGEALGAETTAELRAELVQVAAMALGWIDRIDAAGNKG